MIRRLDNAIPSPSMITRMAAATLSKLYNGSPMPIRTMLVSRRPTWAAGNPQRVHRQQHLADNFRRGQVSDQALGAGVAERARQRAANLGGDAKSSPVLFGTV